jgi:hypothetical protein
MSKYSQEDLKLFLKFMAFILFIFAFGVLVTYIGGCGTLKNIEQADVKTRICQTTCLITVTMDDVCKGQIPDGLSLMTDAKDLFQCVNQCDGLPEMNYRCLSRLYTRPPKKMTCEKLLSCVN